MEIGGVIERAERIVAVRADATADAASIESALVAVRQVVAWADAQQAALVAQLSANSSFPEPAIAAAAKSSLAQAGKAKERSDTLVNTPRLAAALDDGAVTAGHVDAVTRSVKQLDEAKRGALLARVESMVDVAAAGTIDEFSKRLRLETKRLQADDGMDRLERQRRNIRVSMWTDDEGMWNLRGRFDPVTGVRLAARIDRVSEARFAESAPPGCPADPIEKQKFLAAHAVASMLDGVSGAGRPGRPEFVVVIDADATGESGPVAEWSIPVEIPPRVVADLCGDGDVHAVVVRNGVVLHAPGELDLGRTTRLANRAQRRALRGLYRNCGIPECSVAYDRCKLHHIVWWRNGGRTDLANLVPVCSVHHDKIHHDGWLIEVGPNRELTLTLPDGTVRNTGPPARRAA